MPLVLAVPNGVYSACELSWSFNPKFPLFLLLGEHMEVYFTGGLGVEVRHTCPSCGKELVLKTHPRGLFAFCGACGLHEWLWSPEDDYEALVENAERMGIPLWKVQAAVEGLAFPGPPRRGGVELGLASERISGRPDPLALGEAGIHAAHRLPEREEAGP